MMLKFFRRLRRHFVLNKSISSYILYAIGEIILVMIGILLALQVNNWNEERINRDEEERLLTDLRSEVLKNLVTLKDCIMNLEYSQTYADSLRMEVGPEKSYRTITKINEWIGKGIGDTKTCEIETNVLQSIKSSGNLNLIRSNEIKSAIGKWTSILQNWEKEKENWEQEFSNITGPYTMKYVSWDDIDHLFNPNDPKAPKSKFTVDPRHMLLNPEFSNVLGFHYWRQNNVRTRLDRLKSQTEQLSQLLHNELRL